MLKYLIFIICLSLFFIVIKTPLLSDSVVDQNSTNTKVSAPTDEQTYDIPNSKYTLSWSRLIDPERISLFANYDLRLSSSEFTDSHICKEAFSGGFYDTNNKPLGLFITDKSIKSKWRQSSLTNGLFLIKEKTVSITRGPECVDCDLALQAGPIIIENSERSVTTLNNVKNARRVLVAITNENKIIFISVYDRQSVFMGPTLAELYDILSNFQKDKSIKLVSAINLDGGAASFFKNDTLILNEISPVGSFFCVW